MRLSHRLPRYRKRYRSGLYPADQLDRTSFLREKRSIAPPTIHCEDKDERLEIDVVNEGARRLPLGAVLTNSFGFGGQNVSIVLGAAR